MVDYVCNGLVKCGIKLCDGNIMVSNFKFRFLFEEVIEEVKWWVKVLIKDVIMYFNIFFDVCCVVGDISLFK